MSLSEFVKLQVSNSLSRTLYACHGELFGVRLFVFEGGNVNVHRKKFLKKMYDLGQ